MKKKKSSNICREKKFSKDTLWLRALNHQGEFKLALYETSSGGMHCFVDYGTEEEGAKHFR